MVKYAAAILVAAALVAVARAEQHHSAPRDLTDLDLFEREIPFDLGDLSARDDADLYTREFFETELSERDLELLERAPSLWFTNAIKQYTAKYGPKPTQPPSSELTTRELDIDAELFERDFADDSDLLERDFDDSDLLERDFEELEARESIWTKIRNFFTGKKGKNDKKKKEEAEKKKKAAEAKKKADADAKKKAEADDLAERDYDDEDLFERDIAEEDLYERDFDEEVFERDVEDDLFEREFDEESLFEREIDELD